MDFMRTIKPFSNAILFLEIIFLIQRWISLGTDIVIQHGSPNF